MPKVKSNSLRMDTCHLDHRSPLKADGSFIGGMVVRLFLLDSIDQREKENILATIACLLRNIIQRYLSALLGGFLPQSGAYLFILYTTDCKKCRQIGQNRNLQSTAQEITAQA